MKNNLRLILAGSLCSFMLIQCSKSDINDQPAADYCDGVVSTYSADVQPLINTYCQLGTSCHSPGSTNIGGEFTNYNQVFAKRDAMRAAIYSGVMPQTGSLTTAQKKKIICWIDNGAVNN